LLIEYIFLLFCSTVIFRATGATRQYDFHPFWSYSRPDLLVENIMNVVVFIPVGLLLCCAFKQITWWKTLLIGCSISITIEALQFFFMKGFSELDDVMHNTLGCILGYMPAWCWGRKWSIMGR
jgi:glycopeptide antibiotics resistance protein